jgi:hypothetical protein
MPKKKRPKGDVERRGGEKRLQDELTGSDHNHGDHIIDRNDPKDRRSRRRWIFTDKYGDEDGDGRADDEFDHISRPSTQSTSSTSSTTSTTSAKKTTSSW